MRKLRWKKSVLLTARSAARKPRFGFPTKPASFANTGSMSSYFTWRAAGAPLRSSNPAKCPSVFSPAARWLTPISPAATWWWLQAPWTWWPSSWWRVRKSSAPKISKAKSSACRGSARLPISACAMWKRSGRWSASVILPWSRWAA